MSKFCKVCGLALGQGLMGDIYYCPHKPSPEQNLSDNCQICGDGGHTEFDCPQPEGKPNE